jgi:hypothetical protein
VPRVVSRRQLSKWALELTPLPPWLFDAARETAGDVAETVALLGPERAPDPAEPQPLHVWIDERILPLRDLDEPAQREAITRHWQELDRRERIVYDRLLTGELRLRVAAAPTSTLAAIATQTATHTIDAILVYAEPAADRRASVLDHYTFAAWSGAELVPIAKVTAGLTAGDTQRLDKWIRSSATARYGPVRHVPPIQVFALGFDSVHASARHKSGLTLRSPRILRWREGADPAHTANLDDLRALIPSE